MIRRALQNVPITYSLKTLETSNGQEEKGGGHSGVRRRRRALVMTDTELKLMAALAIIGLNSQ